jgi:hypothetical protein
MLNNRLTRRRYLTKAICASQKSVRLSISFAIMSYRVLYIIDLLSLTRWESFKKEHFLLYFGLLLSSAVLLLFLMGEQTYGNAKLLSNYVNIYSWYRRWGHVATECVSIFFDGTTKAYMYVCIEQSL